MSYIWEENNLFAHMDARNMNRLKCTLLYEISDQSCMYVITRSPWIILELLIQRHWSSCWYYVVWIIIKEIYSALWCCIPAKKRYHALYITLFNIQLKCFSLSVSKVQLLPRIPSQYKPLRSYGGYVIDHQCTAISCLLFAFICSAALCETSLHLFSVISHTQTSSHQFD